MKHPVWKQLMLRQDTYSPEPSSGEYPGGGSGFFRIFADPDDRHVYHLWFDAHQKGGSVWMHLIEGEEQALLIDTGYGIGDLRKTLQALTDKPLTVVNTHWHWDHTGGNGQFATVWCHENDIPYLLRVQRGELPLLRPDSRFYRAEDIVPMGNSRLLPMRDGTVFDLGGRTLEVVHVPGHSAGNCMLLDSAGGILFSGDTVLYSPTLITNDFPALEAPELLTVEAMEAALAGAMPRLKGVTKLCPSHSCMELPPAYLSAMLRCCRAILEAPEAWEPYDYIPERPGQIRCVENAMVVYTSDRVFRSGSS